MAFTVPDDITWKNLKSGVVLLNLTSGAYYTLNDSAATIWLRIVEGDDEEVIVTHLLTEYEVEKDEASGDVANKIAFLIEEGLLVR